MSIGAIAQLAAAETQLQRATDIAQIVTAGTSLLVFVSILLVARQVKQEALGTRTTLITTVGEAFVAHPEIRPYFYDGIEPQDPEHRARAEAIAVSLSGAMDHVAADLKRLKKHERKAWETYFTDIWNNSPVFRAHMEGHRDWYGPKLRAHLGLSDS